MNIDNELRKRFNSLSIDGKKDPVALTIWVYLVINANYQNSTVNGIEILCGQCLTSFRRLSNMTGLSERQVRTAIAKLIKHKYIKQHSTHYYTIFTVCNYNASSKYTSKSKTKQSKQKAEKALNDEYKERFDKLCEKIKKEKLSDEETEFFNNYQRK